MVAYDATYLALAKTLAAPLVTCDRLSPAEYVERFVTLGEAVTAEVSLSAAEAVGHRRRARALKPRRERQRGG